MAADDGPRETLLRDSRYEREFRSISYRPVNDIVTRFMSSPTRSRVILAEGRDALSQQREAAIDPKAQSNIDLQIAALDAFERALNIIAMAGLEFERVSLKQPKLNLSGVEISVSPTVWVRQRRTRGRDRLGALIIDPAKGDLLKTDEARAKNKKAMQVSTSLMHLHVATTRCGRDEVASAEHCQIVHIHRQEVFTAPENYRRELKNMEAVCRWARRMWDDLKPPSSFDPSRARYRT